MWSDLGNWDVIGDQIDARVAHAGLGGHDAWCILTNPRSRDVRERLRCTRWAPVIRPLLAKQMKERIEDLLADNENPLTRRVLLLEGQSYAGKTTSTMMTILKRTRDAWARDGRVLDDGRRHLPWAYVEVGEGWEYKSLLRAVHRFIDQPFAPSWTSEDLAFSLRDVLPGYRMEGIAFDDAHNLRSRPEGRSVDGYKSMLTGLPVSLVWIGLEPLKDSALLFGADDDDGSSSTKQIGKRKRLFNVETDSTPAELRDGWDTLVNELVPQFHIPEGQMVDLLGDGPLRGDLRRATGGSTGTTYDLLKDAAVASIRGRGSFAEVAGSLASAAIAKAEAAVAARREEPILTRAAVRAARGQRQHRPQPLRAHAVGR